MISLPLLKRDMLSSLKVLLILFAVTAMYTMVIIYMYDPKLADMLTDYQKVLPQMMSAVGMTGAATNLLAFIQIYLYGFIMLVFPMTLSIILTHKLITDHIDSGSFATLLATPNSRMRIMVTHWFTIMANMTILIGGITGAGIIYSQMLFAGELNVKRYLVLNLTLLFIHYAVASMVFLAACLFSESKRFYLFGAGIPIFFFLCQMLANMGGKMENLKYMTIFSLFPGEDIAAGHSGALGCSLIAIGITIILSDIGLRYFKKKDLPL